MEAIDWIVLLGIMALAAYVLGRAARMVYNERRVRRDAWLLMSIGAILLFFVTVFAADFRYPWMSRTLIPAGVLLHLLFLYHGLHVFFRWRATTRTEESRLLKHVVGGNGEGTTSRKR